MVYLERTDDGVTKITGHEIPPHLRAWPVGAIFFGYTPTNPSELLGGGTWVAFAQGRVLVGQNPSDGEFDTLGETGGEKRVTLTANTLPQHYHEAGSLATTSVGDHSHEAGTYSTGWDGNHAHPLERKAGVASGTGVARGDSTASADGTTGSGGTHQHDVQGYSAYAGGHAHDVEGQTGITGDGADHQNMPPYIVVYMWRRTA